MLQVFNIDSIILAALILIIKSGLEIVILGLNTS